MSKKVVFTVKIGQGRPFKVAALVTDQAYRRIMKQQKRYGARRRWRTARELDYLHAVAH